MDTRQLCKFLADLVFPNRCPCCNKIIKWDELICNSCVEQFPEIKKPFCYKCGKTNCICDRKLFYNGCYPITYYEGKIKDGIISLKLKNGINFAEYFSKKIACLLLEQEIADKIDVVTSVPMSRGKNNDRGYNQAEIFAKFVAMLINKPYSDKAIKKLKKNLVQHNLSLNERLEYVKGAFAVNHINDFAGRNVLLCDDIITSGATLNECSEILLKNGAKNVFCAVIASTNLNNIEKMKKNIEK